MCYNMHNMHYERKNMNKLIVLFFVLALSFSVSFAAAEETTNSIPTADVKAEDLNSPNPNFWQYFKLRFQKVFTRNEIKKQELDFKLAKLSLLDAMKAVKAGNQEKATKSLDRYNQLMDNVANFIDQKSQELTTQENLKKLADELTATGLMQAELTEKMKELKLNTEFNEKLVKTKLDILKKMANILEKQNLSEEELGTKIDKMSEKLTGKIDKLEDKFVKKMAMLNEIDEATENDEIEKTLEGKENQNLEEAGKKLDGEKLGEMARKIPGDEFKHLVILQELLGRVPDEAKDAIQEAIEASEIEIKKKIEENPEMAKEFLQEAASEERLQKHEEAIEKMKEKIKDKKVKEKVQEKVKEVREERKTEKKKEETELPEDKGTSSPMPMTSPTKTETPETTKSPKTTSTPETSPTTTMPSPTETMQESMSTQELSGTISNFNFPSFSIKKNSKTKLKITNKDSVPHTYTVENLGLNTGTINGGEAKTIEFTPGKAGSFSVTCSFHPSMSGTLTISE